MFARKGNVVLVLLSIAFGSFGIRVFGRSLTDQEKIKLFESLKNRNHVPLTMDISFTKRVLTEPESAGRGNETIIEETKKLREKAKNDSITLKSVGIPLPDGSEVRLSETRTRIGIGGRLCNDTTVFANMEKTQTWSAVTQINTGYEKNSPSYLIDHKVKQCWIRNGKLWTGYQVLRFGQVDEFIALDIAMASNPRLSASASKKKEFVDKEKSVVDNKVVDEIECIELKSGKAKYRLSLDPNDWNICRRVIWYDDKSGLVSKIEENKEFAKAKGNGNLFPRLIVRKYFDSEGKIEKTEFINITNIEIGLPISEDIFKLDVPAEYSVIDER